MKIRTYTLLIMLVTLLSTNAMAVLAGGWGSGGGKAVVCFSSPETARAIEASDGVIASHQLSQITYLETLDLFHAENTNADGQIARISEEESYVEFLDRMIARIQEADPFFAREILKSRNEFDQRIIGFKHGPVEPTHDENYSPELVENCTLTNIAVQKWDQAVEGHRLFIDMRLFTHYKFTEESKAVLLLHEYLYQVARGKGETDSRSTRILISAILSTNPEIDLKNYIEEFSY